MNTEIRNLFITKSNKLNNRWKYIYNNLDSVYKDKINNSYPEYNELIDKLKSIINSDYKKCPICFKVVSWNTSLTCSKKCSLEHIKQTNIERYGVDNVFKSKLIQDKIKQTNIERYDCENVMHNKTIVEKLKQTNIERYGGHSPQSDHNIKLKKY